jgi:hypothetical protein
MNLPWMDDWIRLKLWMTMRIVEMEWRDNSKLKFLLGCLKNEVAFSKFLFIACDVWKKNVFGD